jgi:hypothetical protein
MKHLKLNKLIDLKQYNMSELKVNKISPRSGTDVTLGDSGDTFTVPAGASIVNNGTVTGFGLTWQSVQTTGFTAVKGNAYPCDTTSAAFTVTLPATPSAGDQVQLVDYAGTFDTNALIIDPNGEDIEGSALDFQLTGEREGVILTYIDSTQGWIATSGINEGTDALEPAPYSIDFLVVAGGGAGGNAGGGAGGYRTSTQSVEIGTAITVTVGDGGTGATYPTLGTSGSASSISGSGLTTISSAGGGYAAVAGSAAASGGSGGGGAGSAFGSGTAGSGNTPSTAPSQGNNGGTAGTGSTGSSGGGGASAVGSNGSGGTGGAGGIGTASSITGSSTYYAGGGGGGGDGSGAGGSGGGGAGATGDNNGTAGTANTGGGGGGTRNLNVAKNGGNGGKGVVILSMPLANFSGTVTGSPTESDDGTTKRLVFNGSGSYTS